MIHVIVRDGFDLFSRHAKLDGLGVLSMSHTDQYVMARRRAEAKYKFFVHAAVYAAVMVLLVIINLVTAPGDIWFIWPLFGWGIAVALHGLRAFVLADRNDILDALTERELRQSGMGQPKESVPRTHPK